MSGSQRLGVGGWDDPLKGSGRVGRGRGPSLCCPIALSYMAWLIVCVCTDLELPEGAGKLQGPTEHCDRVGWGCRMTMLRFQLPKEPSRRSRPPRSLAIPRRPGDAVGPAWPEAEPEPAVAGSVRGPQGGSVREGGALPAHQGLAAAAQGRGRAMRKCQDGGWEAQLRDSAVGPAARPVLPGAATRALR